MDTWLSGLVPYVLAFEASYLLVALGLLFGHAAWSLWERRKHEPEREAARLVMMAVIQFGRVTDEHLRVLRRLRFDQQVQVFEEWGTNLSGLSAARISELAGRLGLVAAAESLCRSWRWPRRLKGIRILTLLGEGAAMVPGMANDVSPVVRAQVAYWAALHPTPEKIQVVLRLLKDRDPFCRFAAQDALHRMGTVVVQPLIEFAATEGGTVAEYAMAVAAVMRHESFSEVASSLIRADSATMRALAVKVLGSVGGLKNTGLLLGQLDDSAVRVQVAAAHALGCLRYWQAAPHLARLLTSPQWDVRAAAARALRELGAPGWLFLRRAQRSPDAFAVDMARHVLDLPMTTRKTVSS